MKLIKSKFEIMEQKPRAIAIPDDMEIGPRMVKEELLNTIYRQIELAGRTCYKSEDKITHDSAKGFVERMISNKHYAMLEHGTVYLMITIGKKEVIDDCWGDPSPLQLIERYVKNKYSKVIFDKNYEDVFMHEEVVKCAYITTNLRVLVENNWMDDLKYICEPTEYHEKRICVRFTCDRGVSHEFVRHRVFSFAQESTRYCNYGKDKFGNELTFIIPSWINIPIGNYTYWDNDWCSVEDLIILKHYENDAIDSFLDSLKTAEFLYFSALKKGWKPQQARAVLPNALKTELIMTGFVSDWEHFFELRDAPTAHPDAQYLAKPLHEEFIKRKYITNE